MNTHVETLTATNGVSVEVATIAHEGHEFTALGAIMDTSNGHVYGYVAASSGNNRGNLTDWQGNVIGTWRTYSRAHRWSSYDRYTMHYVRARVNGDVRNWHGRYNEDGGQLVHLRPMKAAA